MTSEATKAVINDIIERHPKEVAQLFKEFGYNNTPVSTKTVLDIYVIEKAPFLEKLYDIYSSYEGGITEEEQTQFGFNGEEITGEEQYNKFSNFFDSAISTIRGIKTLGKATKQTLKGEDEEATDKEVKKIAGIPVPVFWGILIITILAGIFIYQRYIAKNV